MDPYFGDSTHGSEQPVPRRSRWADYLKRQQLLKATRLQDPSSADTSLSSFDANPDHAVLVDLKGKSRASDEEEVGGTGNAASTATITDTPAYQVDLVDEDTQMSSPIITSTKKKRKGHRAGTKRKSRQTKTDTALPIERESSNSGPSSIPVHDRLDPRRSSPSRDGVEHDLTSSHGPVPPPTSEQMVNLFRLDEITRQTTSNSYVLDDTLEQEAQQLRDGLHPALQEYLEHLSSTSTNVPPTEMTSSDRRQKPRSKALFSKAKSSKIEPRSRHGKEDERQSKASTSSFKSPRKPAKASQLISPAKHQPENAFASLDFEDPEIGSDATIEPIEAKKPKPHAGEVTKSQQTVEVVRELEMQTHNVPTIDRKGKGKAHHPVASEPATSLGSQSVASPGATSLEPSEQNHDEPEIEASTAPASEAAKTRAKRKAHRAGKKARKHKTESQTTECPAEAPTDLAVSGETASAAELRPRHPRYRSAGGRTGQPPSHPVSSRITDTFTESDWRMFERVKAIARGETANPGEYMTESENQDMLNMYNKIAAGLRRPTTQYDTEVDPASGTGILEGFERLEDMEDRQTPTSNDFDIITRLDAIVQAPQPTPSEEEEMISLFHQLSSPMQKIVHRIFHPPSRSADPTSATGNHSGQQHHLAGGTVSGRANDSADAYGSVSLFISEQDRERIRQANEIARSNGGVLSDSQRKSMTDLFDQLSPEIRATTARIIDDINAEDERRIPRRRPSRNTDSEE